MDVYEKNCSLMHALWEKLRLSDDFEFIDALMQGKFSHPTRLRKYFIEAFYPFYKDIIPQDCLTNMDALSLWSTYLHDYSYRSLSQIEHNLYNTFYAVLENQAPTILKRWMNPQQLEEEYGFSQSWQSKARMTSSGSSLPFHKVGKFIKYDRQEIDKWIEDHKIR